MMERLTKGQVIKMTSGKECRVLKELGEGGQGYIYKVRYEGKDMALKWYKMDKIADKGKFYRNLQNNIKKGAPTKAFVWPVELTVPIDGGFGYLMDLIPDGYAEFKHYLLADVHFSGIKALINAALGLIDGFEKLHNAGFSYQDLNDGNFSIHPETGDVLICDNDNVSEYGDNSGIAGKCVIWHRKWFGMRQSRAFIQTVSLWLLCCRKCSLLSIHWKGKELFPSIRVCVKTTKSNVMAFIRFLHGIRWTHATDLCVESIRMR